MAKIKVSHTIDEELVKWIDLEIEKKRFASRSHAIEYALKQLSESEKQKRKQ
jgi:Arc/MetJ-type ribon-helix-helix transcriptional regulator